MAIKGRKRIGDVLVDLGFLDQSQVAEAIRIQKETGARLGDVLVDHGFVTESQMSEALAAHFGVERVELDNVIISPELLGLIPEDMLKRHRVFPISREGRILKLAMADPMDIMAQDDVRAVTRCDIEPYIASEGEIRRAYERHYDLQSTAKDILDDIDEEPAEGDDDDDLDIGESPGVKIVNLILMQGIRDRSSDIHIEPQEKRVRIRFRVDGFLREVMDFPRRLQNDIVSRLKVMASLDITDRRRPQDGRLRVSVEDGHIDLRVSTLPTIYGEKVVLRVLSKSEDIIDLDDLGMQRENLSAVKKMLAQPQGLILVTGPTGSGKTTTLYSFLQRVNQPDINIITIEDPVELRLAGVNQVNINPKAGLTFAAGLRSVLRQDPDVVMVGEMRDRETTEISVRAALTGHLVLSTMHTNSAAATLARLMDMGVEPFMVIGTLAGVVSQRLVRRICPDCKEPVQNLDPLEERFLGDRTQGATLYRGKGCAACGNSGYRGRVAIEEVLLMTRSLRTIVEPGISEEAVMHVALAEGMITLRESGTRRVLSGLTTVKEIVRTVFSVDENMEAGLGDGSEDMEAESA